MKSILAILGLLIAPILIVAGCVKGSTNPTIDKEIKSVEGAYPIDNPVEEAIEEEIEAVTGLEVDLSAGLKEVEEKPATVIPQSLVPPAKLVPVEQPVVDQSKSIA